MDQEHSSTYSKKSHQESVVYDPDDIYTYDQYGKAYKKTPGNRTKKIIKRFIRYHVSSISKQISLFFSSKIKVKIIQAFFKIHVFSETKYKHTTKSSYLHTQIYILISLFSMSYMLFSMQDDF